MLYYHFPPSSPSSSSDLENLAESRNYAHRDEITVSPSAMGAAYEDKIKMFFDEHMHEDEEIRYIRDGHGFFDVRDASDRWVRIRAEPGDLLVLPAGIYHRFTVDEANVCGSCWSRPIELATRKNRKDMMTLTEACKFLVHQRYPPISDSAEVGSIESQR